MPLEKFQRKYCGFLKEFLENFSPNLQRKFVEKCQRAIQSCKTSPKKPHIKYFPWIVFNFLLLPMRSSFNFNLYKGKWKLKQINKIKKGNVYQTK